MFQEIIQLGQIQIALLAYTTAAQECLLDFLSHLPEKICILKTPSCEVKWKLYIIASDPSGFDALNITDNRQGLWTKLHRACLSLGASGMGSFFSIQTEPYQIETEFVHFISHDYSIERERAIILVHIAQIVRRWLMVNGNISLHASTIVRNGFGFLFLGQSGAGKTTVTILSKEKAQVLNDEKIFLTPLNGNFILSQIPTLDEIGETVEENLMIRNQSSVFGGLHFLSGIFVLKQDRKDFLIAMSNLTTAHALMESFFELPRIFQLSHQELLYALNTLSQVARKIPAYELHFRKSPDFWKLIDDRFPD